MASTQATRVHFPNEVGPLKSVILCFLGAVVFGFACGLIVWILWHVFSLPGGPHPWIATGAATFGMAAAVWANCTDIFIETGSVGVPTFGGKRIRYFPPGAEHDTNPQARGPDGKRVSLPTNMSLLSEGTIKVPPLFGAVPVNVQLKTSEEKPVRAASGTGLIMSGKVSFLREVVNPYLFLSAENPDDSLFGIAGTVVENQFPCYCPDEFKSDKTKGLIRDDMKDKVDDEDYKFGLNVTDIYLSELLPPQEVSDNYAKLEIEIAQARAEETEWNAVRKRVREAADEDGIDIHRAFEYFQAERGKATANRNTHRLEGLEPLIQILESLKNPK